MAKFEAEFTRQFHQALTSIFQKSDNHSIIYIIWRQSGDDVAEGIAELRGRSQQIREFWAQKKLGIWFYTQSTNDDEVKPKVHKKSKCIVENLLKIYNHNCCCWLSLVASLRLSRLQFHKFTVWNWKLWHFDEKKCKIACCTIKTQNTCTFFRGKKTYLDR